jgi:type III secretion protein T
MDLAAFEEPAQLLTTLGYAMPRLLAMFSMIPMLSRAALPGLLRTGVVMGMGVLLVPMLFEQAIAHRGAIDVLLVLAKEVVLGMAIGLVMAIPLWALETMGAFIDNQRGASVAQIINPLTGHDSSPLGELFSQAAITYLLVGGGLLSLLGTAYASYEVWPVFASMPRFDAEAARILLGQLDRLTRLAVLLGAPAIIAMFLAETGLALVSRFAPQLQVFFLAMPIKSGIALFVFAVYGAALFDLAGAEILGLGGALDTVRSLFVRGGR